MLDSSCWDGQVATVPRSDGQCSKVATLPTRPVVRLATVTGPAAAIWVLVEHARDAGLTTSACAVPALNGEHCPLSRRRLRVDIERWRVRSRESHTVPACTTFTRSLLMGGEDEDIHLRPHGQEVDGRQRHIVDVITDWLLLADAGAPYDARPLPLLGSSNGSVDSS